MKKSKLKTNCRIAKSITPTYGIPTWCPLKLNKPDVMRSFSIEDLRKAFEDAKKGGIERVPVVID